MISKLHHITQGDTGKSHQELTELACKGGIDWVQLRVKDTPYEEWKRIAQETREICDKYNVKLIINDNAKLALEVKADGVHLGKTDVCPTLARKHLYTWQMIGGTANTLQDCEALLDKQIDYISLGPLRATTTKANISPILGLKGYYAITDVLKTPIPIIAVGGITTDDVADLLEAGISGLAVSEVITHNFDSIKTFNQLLKASVTAEQRYTFE